MRLTIFVVIILLVGVTAAKAETYKRVAPPTPQSAPASQTASARQAPTPQPARSTAPKVEVYVTSWCSYCKKTINYLNQKGVAYTAYDIEGDPAAKERYRALGGEGVPLVVIGSNKIAGYSPAAMEHYLKAP